MRLATFSQHHVDGLDLALTPLAVMIRTYPGLKEEKARSHLSSFGISAELATQSMYTLSGGQKNRVAFAKVRSSGKDGTCREVAVSYQQMLTPAYDRIEAQSILFSHAQLTFTQPHILLLDEPSNHLVGSHDGCLLAV